MDDIILRFNHCIFFFKDEEIEAHDGPIYPITDNWEPLPSAYYWFYVHFTQWTVDLKEMHFLFIALFQNTYIGLCAFARESTERPSVPFIQLMHLF